MSAFRPLILLAWLWPVFTIAFQAEAHVSLSRLAAVVDNRLPIGAQTTTYTYDNVGNLGTFAYPNGLTHTYGNNAQNRLTSLYLTRGGSLYANYSYTLGPFGNRIAVTEPGRTITYGYDNLYRLKSENITQGGGTTAAGYTYDNVGNRTVRASTIGGVSPATASYTARDLLTTDTYDNNGNTTVSGSAGDSYDFENHLVNRNNGAVQIVYDGDGNRVKKITPTQTTYYLVDDRNPTGYAQVLEELSAPGSAPTVTYTYGHSLISQNRGGVAKFYGYDGHNNVRSLTDAGGNWTDAYTYDAFGILIGQSGSTANNYLYCGEQFDPDLGMYYLRARYLNPGTGRFWTMDSFEGNSEDPLSLHKYLYCESNPVNGIDPSGNEFELGSVLSAIGNGVRMTAQMGLNGYSAYARAKWLKDSVEFVGTAIATGTFDPLTLGLLISDVIPFGKIAGTAGKVPGLRNVLGSMKNLSNSAKGKVGEMLANAVARGKGYLPSGFRPRGNGGFDGLFKEGNVFVVVEGKLGANPLLNAASGSNPAQMSKEWIEKNIGKAVKEMEQYDPQLANELKEAYKAGRIKGMVVKTQIDAAGNVIDDPSFIVKELTEIGEKTF